MTRSSNIKRKRDAYAKRHNHHLDEIVADLRKRERAHPDRIVDRRALRTAASNVNK